MDISKLNFYNYHFEQKKNKNVIPKGCADKSVALKNQLFFCFHNDLKHLNICFNVYHLEFMKPRN